MSEVIDMEVWSRAKLTGKANWLLSKLTTDQAARLAMRIDNLRIASSEPNKDVKP